MELYARADYTDFRELICLDLSTGTKKGGDKRHPFLTTGYSLELIHSVVFT
jgi:hypothetical protein